MDKFKEYCKKIFMPPVWVIILLVPIAAVSLFFVFLNDLSEHPFGYFVYALNFYALTVFCVWCFTVLPNRIKEGKARLYNTKYGNKFLSDIQFRTHVMLYVSLFVNLFYVLFNGVLFVYDGSYWFLILSVYYVILAVMRFLLVRYFNKNSVGSDMIGEWKRARVCAFILTLINLVLSGAVLMIISQGKGFTYPGMFIYVMAMYTFYVTILAIINIVKYKKYNSPVMSATKVVTLAAALVSMLSLETAMLNEFGSDTPQETKNILIAVTGAVICIVVMCLSVGMIIQAAKEIKKGNNK